MEKLRKMLLEGDVSEMEKKGKKLLTVVFQQMGRNGKIEENVVGR
jgi:hypothetical protein